MTTFKAFTSSDSSLVIKMMEDFYSIDNYPFDNENSRKLLHQFLQDENLGKGWLIYHENEVVGYVILIFIFSFEYQGKIAFLDELYIKKTARGKGIGRRALQFIQEEAPKLSLKVIYLEVEPHNETAQKLYLANDFAIHKRKLLKYTVN
ncbi:GNAT family N-acetyltransferase [Flavobacterium sp.]|jgi:ribosomal protein S18 acetylase RimI-like enzyme|uniref:GNAT family N-acetyltransferase n=1 Tax=Flavobacterium sp. TaxID=239 RepID=UPI0037C01476